jgi:hypothetical protein
VAVAMIDDGHAGCHSATVAENSSASLKTSTMIGTHDLGMGGGTNQNKQTSNSNRSHFIVPIVGHAQGGGYCLFWQTRFLVALAPVWDLLLLAKSLFVAARFVWHEVQPSCAEREATLPRSEHVARLMASRTQCCRSWACSNRCW